VKRRAGRGRAAAAAVALGLLAAAAFGAAKSDEPASAEPTPDAVRWLALVEPLISPVERQAYLALERDYQRRAFEERFWKVRDPFPETPANEFALRWLVRAPEALERWHTMLDERAIAFVAAGEPQSTLTVSCPDLLRPAEIWTLPDAGRLHGGLVTVFVADGVARTTRYRAWRPRDGVFALATVGGAGFRSPEDLLRAVASRCYRGAEIASYLTVAADWSAAVERGRLLPQPGDEWVRSFASLSTDLPDDAAPLAAELTLDFPGRVGSRTLVEGTLALASPPAVDTGLQLDGEVLRGDELFEHFRYRFQAPAGSAVPLVFERRLRPGEYRLIVRLRDATGNRYFRHESTLVVPLVGHPRAVAAGGPAPDRDEVADDQGAGEEIFDAPTIEEALAADAADATDTGVRILLPSDELLTGKVRFEAVTRGAGVAAVAFSLDGKRVLTKRREPFNVELDLGRSPRLHRVGATALGDDGSELARDETLVNGGPHRFAVRLVEPQSIPAGARRVHARAEVDVPEGEALERLEFYVNDSLIATLYQPPFVQSLPLPAGKDVAWIRAAARLVGGGGAEDVRLVGAGEYASGVDVDFVELYASAVDRRGRPVEDLRPDEITVLESGQPQALRRFEQVADLPMHAAILLDTSSSMVEELDEAERAALRFFSEVLTERDRAAVLTFADTPRVAVRFTPSVEVLAGGLADLEADGNTSLWDALAFALHYFSGIRGRRALVLISDGRDSGSRFSYEQILEYAQRTGVEIYVIGMDVPTRPPEVGMFLDRLAVETGGRAYRISRAVELGPIYRSIQNELRSQYLIAYQSSAPQDDGFRKIEVEVSRPGVQLRTTHGYYP